MQRVVPSLLVLTITLGFIACTLHQRVDPPEVEIPPVERIGLGVLIGPESTAEDSQGFIYTGIRDGSIRKIDPITKAITTYAYAVPSITDRSVCQGNESLCGVVLGLKFDSHDNLYAIDAYRGLILIPRSDINNVQILSTSSNGTPFAFANSLLINTEETTIYFTDSSTTDGRNRFPKVVLDNKPNARLLKYDIASGVTTTLADGLKFANGIAFGPQEEYILINETSDRKIKKVVIKGPRAGTVQNVVADIGGYNDNIEVDPNGDYLVALYSKTSPEISAVQKYPKLINIFDAYVPGPVAISLASPMGLVKVVHKNGTIRRVFIDRNATNIGYLADASIHGDYVYFGSVVNPFLGRVRKSVFGY